MTDPTNPTPAAATASSSSAASPKPKRPRADLNQRYVDEVSISRKVAAAALDPAHTAALAAVELDATLPGKIVLLSDAVEAALGRLAGARTGKKVMTAQEKTARDALLAVIAPIQTAAKRKFSGGDALLREAYFIGNNLSGEGLDNVLTAARTILARLTPGKNNEPPKDVLPGIKSDQQIKDLDDAIATYGGKDQAQGEKRKEAASTREEIEAKIEALADLRRQIQLAADQAWPWRSNGVVTIRKAFLLPADRPLAQ